MNFSVFCVYWQKPVWCHKTIPLCFVSVTFFFLKLKSGVFGTNTVKPFLPFSRPLLPATGPQTQASFCWGIPMATKPITREGNIKTCTFKGHRNTCRLGWWGGPGLTCSHVQTQSHTDSCSHKPHKETHARLHKCKQEGQCHIWIKPWDNICSALETGLSSNHFRSLQWKHFYSSNKNTSRYRIQGSFVHLSCLRQKKH